MPTSHRRKPRFPASGRRLRGAVSRPKKVHRCPIYQHVATQIRKMRRSLGLTQDEVAEAMGIHRWAYQKIETARQAISLERILEFSRFFGCHYLTLIEGYVPTDASGRHVSTGPRLDISDPVLMGSDPLAPGAPDTTPVSFDDSPSYLDFSQSSSESGGLS